MYSCRIAVYAEQKTVQEKACLLAEELSYPLISELSETWDLLLLVNEEYLALRDPHQQKQKPFWIDFGDKNLENRRLWSGKYKELLARAVGLPRINLKVFDATAGFARESFLLAALGASVTAVERMPVLIALIRDGIFRAKKNPELARIFEQKFHLISGDSRSILATLPPEECPDVIYLDPMFPERKKSALVKKEMRLLRLLNGFEESAEELFLLACQKARRRVVVKRPIHAPPFKEKPSFSYTGEHTRFDLYVRF
ncbi:MAG: class I SAM-dependent methyltransferase [Planctomycetota bacterium]